MPDAIVGATYHDRVVDMDFEVVGIYERPVRNDNGAVIDTEVVVDATYENSTEPIRVELASFKNDECIELVRKPAHAV